MAKKTKPPVEDASCKPGETHRQKNPATVPDDYRQNMVPAKPKRNK